MNKRRHTAAGAAIVAGSLAAALGVVINMLPERGVVAPAAPPNAGAAEEARVARPVEDDTKRIFDSHFQAGVVALQQGHYHRAAEVFQLAWRMAPNVPEVHVNLGFAFVGLNEYDRAVEAFNKAIDLRPQQANAYFGLAESLQELDDKAGALGAMRTYVHLTAEDDPFRRRALAAIWELEEAVGRPPPLPGPQGEVPRKDAPHPDAAPPAAPAK